ncbi:hypothetical protein M514_02005 [Trichuris suis]|uniref:Tc1-like transposase DDE domain-containing protein n=1 Tax=Trichuris suis TaxID=68888 RepID=A0A085NJJ3_9BILA|nr:hypothetical protein M514_02005 [Trichuris suis]
MRPRFLTVSSREMKRGSSNMTPRVRSNPSSGYRGDQQVQSSSKAERSARKVMATTLWDSDGVILTDFLEGERTVTASSYKAVLRKLKTALARKWRGKLLLGVFFHNDNAVAHSSRTVRNVLREFRWEVISHPRYSPGVAPSDFFLFPKLKEHLKGTLFESMDDAKCAVSTWCNTQPSGFYKEGPRRWRRSAEVATG